MERTQLVFVYGTLMQGERHHEALAHAAFLRLAETLPEFELVQIDYFPALLKGGSQKVLGELYEVDEATLHALDVLEEVPDYYVREAIRLSDGTRAQTYLLPRERAQGAQAIASGYFRLRTAPPRRGR